MTPAALVFAARLAAARIEAGAVITVSPETVEVVVMAVHGAGHVCATISALTEDEYGFALSCDGRRHAYYLYDYVDPPRVVVVRP